MNRVNDSAANTQRLYDCPRCGRERLPDSEMTFYSTVAGYHSSLRPYICRSCHHQVGLAFAGEVEQQRKAGRGNFRDRPEAKPNDSDTIRDVMEELFPNSQPCPYPGCTVQVSRYDIEACCRYCQGYYCPAHAGYQQHGCCATL